MSLKSETRGITVTLIFEVIGRPAEKLTETLNEIIKKIDEENGVSVKSKKVNEPIPMKEQQDFFTSFAEVEVEVEEISNLAILIFKYMPAHIEIVEPELIALTSNRLNEIFNEVARRLHGYDEVARVIQMEKGILEKKLRALMKNQKEKVEEKKE